MFVVLNIEVLQRTSLADVIKYYLPKAKVACITYNIQWTMLHEFVPKHTPDDVKVYWMRADHPNMVDAFEGFVVRACMTDAVDHIFFMDHTTSSGKKMFAKYRTCTEPGKRVEPPLHLLKLLRSIPFVIPEDEKCVAEIKQYENYLLTV